MYASQSPRPLTLRDVGIERLVALLRVFGYGPARIREAATVFTGLAVPWGTAAADAPPAWPSDITDDHTPFEFSVAIDGGVPEVRCLLEVQGQFPSVASNWRAALDANDRMARGLGANTRRLDEVLDLFEPSERCARFALWHGVCFDPHSAPDLKVYLNPLARARGDPGARGVVEEALDRLGLGSACAYLPPESPDVAACYFSLDLSDDPMARVKVYLACYRATAAQIEAMVASARGHAPGRAAAFCRAMADADGPYDKRPVLTCLSFVTGSARPTAATVHFPVRSYAENDAVVRDRVLRHVPLNVGGAYRKALDTFAHRPLATASGMQTYVSLRLESRRFTVYLAPELYAARRGRE